MALDQLRVYTRALALGETIWDLVSKWRPLARETLGKQVIRAADSIAANISEGYGRYHFKENRHFCFYARGSLYETMTWLKKANNRKLINAQDYESLTKELTILAKMLNKYISLIGNTKSSNKQ